MFIQPVANQNINNLNFQGKLGKALVAETEKSVPIESHMKSDWKFFVKNYLNNKSGIKKLLQKIGLGAWGFVSIKNFFDILYELQDYIYYGLVKMRRLSQKLSDTETDLGKVQGEKEELENRLSQKEKEFKDMEYELSLTSAALDAREEILDKNQETLSNGLAELYRQQFEIKSKNDELQKRTEELNKREQNIEEMTVARVTAQIRTEEQNKAGRAYEERIKALETKEQSLNKKEKALINTENIIRQAEVEKIKGELRVFYGIQDTENKSYSSFGEQMVAVASILNNSRSFDSKNQLTLRYITEALQDNEGIITAEKLQFLERILNLDDEIQEGYLHNFMCLAQDESGNLDSEKAAYLLAALSWNKEGHQKVIDDFAEYYHLKSTYENQPKEELFMALINQAVFDENMPDTELLEKIKNFDYLQECGKPSLIFANKKMKGSYLWLNQEDDSTSFKLIKQIIENLERIINFKTVKGE